MINQKIHSLLLIAVAYLSSCIFLVSCENNVNEVRALGEKIGGIDVGKDVSIFISNDGKIAANLKAPIMNKYLLDSGKMIEFPHTIQVDFYKDSLVIESKLFAKYAKYLENENKIYLREDVVVYNVLGDTLWCKEMTWDQSTSKFYTNQDVIVKQHNPISKIYGKGLEANQNLTDIKIIKPQSNSFAIISDSSELNPQ